MRLRCAGFCCGRGICAEERWRAWAQGGIATADRLVTVSPGYAGEIQTVEGGWDLHPLLSRWAL